MVVGFYRFQVALILVAFTFAEFHWHCEAFDSHGFQHSEACPEKIPCNCPQTLVLSQARGDQAPPREAEEHLSNLTSTSFQRRELPWQHCSSNGGEHSLEVRSLQTASKAQCSLLPGLSSSVATGDGPFICPPIRTSATTSDQLELRSSQLGHDPSVESSTTAIAIPNSEFQATLQQCEDTERAKQGTGQGTRRRSGQRQGQSCAASSTSSSMARICHAWTASASDANPACSADDADDRHGHTASRLQLADHATAARSSDIYFDYTLSTDFRGERVDGDDQNKTDGAAPRHATEGPELHQERGSKSYQRPSHSRTSSGTSPPRSGRCTSSQIQLDSIVENLPHGCDPNLAGICDALSTAREGRQGQDPGSPRAIQPSQHPVGTISDGRRQSQDHRDQRRGRRVCRGPSQYHECVRQDPRQLQDLIFLFAAAPNSDGTDRDGDAGGQETTLGRAFRCRQGHGSFRRGGCSIQGTAFYLGRLSMTYGYDSQGPCQHWDLECSSAVIMKWTHRRIHHHAFVSEWQAREHAIGLAFSLHGPAPTTTPTSCSSLKSSFGILKRSTSRTSRRISFSSHVDVWIGDCNTLEMYNITVPELCLACGLSPWSNNQHAAEPIQHKPDPSEAHLPPLPEDRAVSSQMTGHREPTNLRELPHWFSQIWGLLDEEGLVEDENEGEVIYVNSFYISHANNLFQDRGRPLRFSHHLESWVNDISMVWGDLFDRQAPFSATLVMPEPAFNTMPDTVGTMLIVQHHTPLRTACLTTAVEPLIPRANIIQIAHSFDVVIPFRHVLLHGRASDVCDSRSLQGLGQCMITIGRLELPFGQPIRLHEGVGLTIHIPPPVPQDQWEAQLVERPHSLYPQRDHWDWGEGDTVNMMARSMTLQSSDRRRSSYSGSSTSSTSSSSSSSSRSTRAAPWQEALLFLRDGRTATASMPNDGGPIACQVAADAFNIQQGDIIELHSLQFIPSDLAESQMEVYLVQLAQDGPSSSIMRLTLVDVEIYLPGETQPSTYTRRVHWLPNFVNQLSLFRLLRLEDHYTETPERCHLYVNDFEIEQCNDATIDIMHGHYISIYIGACDPNLLDRMIQEMSDDDSMELIQTTGPSDIQKRPVPYSQLRTDQHIEPPGLDRGCQTTPTARQAGQTFQGLTPQWSLSLVRAFHREAFTEMEEEGQVAYVVTWLVQHESRPQCLLMLGMTFFCQDWKAFFIMYSQDRHKRHCKLSLAMSLLNRKLHLREHQS